ncbi:MAG: pstS [Lacunisphaera sp.]|nr:pstS [Lacunisphaera sp.]
MRFPNYPVQIMRKLTCLLFGINLGLISLAAGAGVADVDPSLPGYQPQGALRGELHSVGADVMDDLTMGWIKLFRATHPKVAVTMEARAPGTAIPALVNGWGQLGPVARELFPFEEEQFVEKFGYKPTVIRVATASFDQPGTAQTIVFCVNEKNPITALTFAQVREIFGKDGAITKWGQLGLTGDWAERPIELWGLKQQTGVANYLKLRVMNGREFRSGINERVNQDDINAQDTITTGVAAARYALGYARLGSLRSGVKALALAEQTGNTPMAPTLENVVSHRYPLGRFIYIYVNRPPGKPLDPNVREFLRLVLSREGQEIVARQGLYLPLNAAIVAEERAKLE